MEKFDELFLAIFFSNVFGLAQAGVFAVANEVFFHTFELFFHLKPSEG